MAYKVNLDGTQAFQQLLTEGTRKLVHKKFGREVKKLTLESGTLDVDEFICRTVDMAMLEGIFTNNLSRELIVEHLLTVGEMLRQAKVGDSK